MTALSSCEIKFNLFVNTAVSKSRSKDLTVVAIGASAGGLEPIHELFDNMPDDTGFAFVVVQHLSPDHKSLMRELLAKHTNMAIVEAVEDMQLKPDCVHLIPSKKVMTLSDGALKLHDKDPHKVPNNAIDTFFESLAGQCGRNAIAIILSGTGSDGSKGIAAIKNAGGFVIVQDPLTADFDGMPTSAIQTGAVDLVLPPELMAEELVEVVNSKPYLSALDKLGTDDENIIHEILDHIRSVTAQDFNQYKKPTITRRLAKRMVEAGFKDLRDYHKYLLDNSGETKLLAKEFLINVTRFFRDEGAFEEIKNKVIPPIFSGKKPHDTIKVWIVACSSGEEAYSIAMMFYEYMNNIRNFDYNIKIFATDIDKDAVQTASLGLYPESIEKDVSFDRLNRFFIKEGNQYRIVPAIRKMVVFAFHDITKDPPFGKLDLISCRNMLIYMSPKLQAQVLKTFLFALNHGSTLVLGSSENIGVLKDSMKEVSKKWKIFRCTGKNRGLDKHNLLSPISYTSLIASGNKPRNATQYLADIFKETLLDENRYAGILIDENMDVKQAIGHFKEFLEFPENNLTFNLLKLVSGDLAVAIGISVRKAIHENNKVVMRNVRVFQNGIEREVTVIVRPYIHQHEYQQSFLFVILHEDETPKKVKRTSSAKHKVRDQQRLEELEKQLNETRENLQSVIEELESSNEELLTSNEEMISANEELQSTNEELQSLNEELHTVSAEHQLKIKELIELNDDLNNYFRNNDIGQILIDQHMIVRKFSPAITKLINLIETDIGRPLVDITNNIRGIDLIDCIRSVMTTGATVEKEVSTENEQAFLMRINPYIRQDKSVDGVVINFIDITEIRHLNSIIEGVFNSTSSAIVAQKAIRDSNGVITDFECVAANPSAEQTLGLKTRESLRENITKVFPEEDRWLENHIEVVASGQPFQQEFYNAQLDRWFEVMIVKMQDGTVSTFNDVTAKKKAADLIAKSYAELKDASVKLQETNYRLEQSNMDLLQFASVASHDLKEPLRKIQTFGNMLNARISHKIEQTEKNWLDKIVNSSNRMQTLIEDVLTLSKLSNTDIPFAKTDLSEMLKHIVDDLEITIRETNSKIILDELPTIEAVPGQIHQLFQNLISNALKFNENPNPCVRIRQRSVDEDDIASHGIENPSLYVAITVDDNGIGFDQRYREKIFGIFQRVHNNQYQGTGIGLAICRKIVENHHGFIRASGEEGKGSSFIVLLPVKQKAEFTKLNGHHTDSTTVKVNNPA